MSGCQATSGSCSVNVILQLMSIPDMSYDYDKTNFSTSLILIKNLCIASGRLVLLQFKIFVPLCSFMLSGCQCKYAQPVQSFSCLCFSLVVLLSTFSVDCLENETLQNSKCCLTTDSHLMHTLMSFQSRGTPRFATPPRAPVKSCPVTRIFTRINDNDRPQPVSFREDSDTCKYCKDKSYMHKFLSRAIYVLYH